MSTRSDLRSFFVVVLEKIAEHPSYGAALDAAVERNEPLVLNYHTHGPGEDYCVSIATVGVALEFLGQDPPLHELAHIRGIGKEEVHCEPLMTAFADLLVERFELSERPVIYLNAKPFQGLAG